MQISFLIVPDTSNIRNEIGNIDWDAFLGYVARQANVQNDSQ